MQRFLISFSLLLALTAAVIVNAHCVTGYLRTVSQSLEALPVGEDAIEEAAKKSAELSDDWEAHLFFLSLSIGLEELQTCTSTLRYTADYAKAGDAGQYVAYLDDAKGRVRALLSRESFSFENVV